MMKLNQFARIQPDLATQKKALVTIGLIDDDERSFAEIAQTIFANFFPEALTAGAKHDKLAQVAVSVDENLAQWLGTDPEHMSRRAFYAVALQLLGFEAITTFALEDPLTFMQETHLPYVKHDLETVDQLLAAVYLLLNTRTPHLVTYLDDLANRGFFRHFQDTKHQPEFLVFNGKVQAVFDTHQIHREVVWIESDLDSDGDGKADLLEATIFRPAETDRGLKVPVLFTADPYFHGTNDVTAVTHQPADQLAEKSAGHLHFDPAPAEPNSPITKQSVKGQSDQAAVYADEDGIYSLNDYFLARGFATVYSGGVGTRYSDGFRTIGGHEETASATAVIQWLTGARKAFTNRTDGIEIKAWWSSGKVAMTGKSYLGTLAIAAATSGVSGLKTIISESAISSWYDYYRENGLVVAPGGFQGEDVDVLAVDTFSRQKSGADYAGIRTKWAQHLKALDDAADRVTGDYNAWWDERNYRNQVANIKCDIVSVHGLNDWNVKPKNVIALWQALANAPIHKKLFLHQGQHVYLNNVLSLDFTDMMNLWLSYELLDVANDAPTLLPNVTIQDNVAPQTWHTAADFAQNTMVKTLRLGEDLEAATDQFTDHATEVFNHDHGTSERFEKQIITPRSPYANSRLWLTLPAFDHDVTLNGIPHLHLRLQLDQPTAIISVRLIDLGLASRFTENAEIVARNAYKQGFDFTSDNILEFGLAPDKTPSKLISLGHANAQNRGFNDQIQSITPHEPFELDFDLQPTYYRLPSGRQFGLIIHGADMAQTLHPVVETTYTIDLANSQLTLPFERS